MHFDTDVLIVGAGPTGLMMACQLKRFNIPFQIIEKQADQAHESRAFGVQARSMEIFQNLGIVDQFLKRVQPGAHAQMYVNGKLHLQLDIEKLNIKGTPFPTIYFLPQSETEEILIDHLQKNNVSIQRSNELNDLSISDEGIVAEIQNLKTNENKKISCKYVVGCDGAHSKVRELLKIPFEGASYTQEFMLADGEAEWEFPKHDGTFRFFVNKNGIFGVIPLPKHLDRILGARVTANNNDTSTPTVNDVDKLATSVSQRPFQLQNMVWSSRFHLHHRAVRDYQVGRVFIAGDAAHIHTPVGGQGMNTGLQDATNLAWKLAFVLKYGAPEELLNTYQAERHMIGQILVKTTDRIFGLMTSKNIFVQWFRLNIIPFVMDFITKSERIKQKIFLFISELSIHYKKNDFTLEEVKNADKKFVNTLGAGYRAPDAPFESSTLFNKFAEFPCHILLFISGEKLTALQEQQLEDIEKLNSDLIRTLTIKNSPETEVIFDRYGVRDAAIYFIRPDGYIGFRSYGLQIEALLQYFNKLLTH